MRPLTVINGFIMGTFVAIAIGLAVVSLLFAWHAGEYAQLEAERVPLLVATGLFTVGAVVSVLAFLGQLRRTAWRWWAELALLACIGATAAYFII